MQVAARLLSRWYLVILAVIISLGAAATTQFSVGHGGLKRKRQTYHVASGQLLVDTNPSSLTNVRARGGGLSGKTALIAQYATGRSVVNAIARADGLDPKALTVQAQASQGNKAGGTDTKKAAVGHGANSVLLRAGHDQTIGISVQAPTKRAAKKLVYATMTGLTRSLVRLQKSQPFNRTTTATTTTSSTTTTTATSGKTGQKSGKAAAARAAAKAKRLAAQAKQHAIEKANQISSSEIVLRRFGAVTAAKLTVTPSKSKTVGYFVVALIILLLLILTLDNVLQGSRRRKTVAATPTVND